MLLKLLLLLCCLGLIQGAVVPAQDEVQEIAATVKFLNNAQMAKFLNENPNAIRLNREIITESTAKGRALDAYTLKWTLAARQTGDVQVGSNVSPYTYEWEYPQSPEIFVGYPASGTGRIVTHVSITTKQSSPFGDAYVSKGGIGQRNIEFYVLGYWTYYYSWDIKIYGK